MSAARASPTVSCPSCGNAVVWSAAAKFRPFCSERCKMLDLGAWATERYRVGGEDAAANAADPSEGGHDPS